MSAYSYNIVYSRVADGNDKWYVEPLTREYCSYDDEYNFYSYNQKKRINGPFTSIDNADATLRVATVDDN